VILVRSLTAAAFAAAIVPAAVGAQSMPMPMASPTPASTATMMPMPGMSPSMPMRNGTSTPMPAATTMPSTKQGSAVPVVPNPSGPGWPSPVEDNPHFSYLLIDQLEEQSLKGGVTGTRWDATGWTGGDVNRLWFKTEGFSSFSPQYRSAEASVLYGKLIKPFYDFQAGIRFVPGLGLMPSRTYAVIGLQGLAPYNFDVEPSLFISQNGKVSARFTGSYDIPLTQKLILQPWLETNLAFQQDQAVGIGSGLNDINLALRLRYEIRREFAPYIGISWQQRFGQTHAFALRQGPDPVQFPIVAGVRIWF
jgi:copper resistance protein B